MADYVRVDKLVRIKLTRNSVNLYEQVYELENQTFVEFEASRVVLATNMSAFEEYNMGAVTTAQHVMVEVDQEIRVALNAEATSFTVGSDESGGVLMIGGTGITHLYFKNENTTYTATANVVVTDED